MPARLAALSALLTAAFLLLAPSLASAQDLDLIHYWNFNSPAGGSAPWPQPLEADFGNGTLTYDFPGSVVSFGGTSLNAALGAPAGQSFVVQGGSGLGNNGRHFQLNVSLQGYQNIAFSYASQRTASGFNAQRAEFSVDGGGTWTEIGTWAPGAAGAFEVRSEDLSAYPELDGAPNVIFRVTLTGATSDNGNNRFDNIRLEGVFVGGGGGTGTGTATVEPGLLEGGASHALSFTVAGISDEPAFEITHVDLTLPEGWGPVAAADVTVDPAGADVEVVGQTVRLSGLEVSQSQPVGISLADVFVAAETGDFTFGIRTGSGTDETVPIAGQPSVLVWGAPIPIAEASENDAQGVSTKLGEWVTIRGVVTTADDFATAGGEIGPAYLEDASAGMAVFSPEGVSAQVERGEEVVLFGRVTQFYGLNQLDETTVVMERVSAGNEIEPEVVTLAELASDGAGGVEVYEGRLVRVNGVTVDTPVWNVESGETGTNYVLTDPTGTLEVRVNTNVDFAGQPAPSGPFDLVGVVSQFRPSAPYIGGYQLLPRSSADIIDESGAPAITSAAPFESAATPTSVTLSWTTSRAAHSEVRYVAYTTGEAGAVIDEEPKTQHSLTITGLDPATVYTVEIRSAAGEDTTRIAGYPVVTRAPEGSTHAIQPVFTGSVDHDLALETPAVSSSPLPRLLERINAAEHTIDMALYSLSGSTGSAIASALIAAHQRGVAVRVVMENSNSSTAPPTALQNAGVPFITDAFGANSGQALHHNKFGVFDAYDGAPEDVWVLTGSWNPTDPGTQQHKQNVVFIQDASVAAAFTREFDQMWGSRTTTPDAAHARFGSRKQLVAPTVLWIGDTRARLFFSPQGFGAYGSTEQQIIRALEEAQHEIDLGLNLITRISLVNAMHARFDAGVKVRGAIGETGTTGSVFQELAAWADVHAYPSSQEGLLHHKYALVDAEHPAAGPVTITGSHNWSRSANEANDENTLFLYSADVTNQFLQEFAERYREAGGEGGFEVALEELPVTGDLAFSLSGNYPNPFATTTTFEYSLGAASSVRVVVYDVLGREVARVLEAEQPAGAYRVTFDASHLASGIYLYRVEAASAEGHVSETGRMVIAR